MVVRMRVTRAHRDNRRSHHALKGARLSKCSNCGAYHLRHRMCPECGFYRGKQIIDVVALAEKRLQKKQAKLEEMQQEQEVSNSESSESKKASEKAEKKTKDTKSEKKTKTDK